MYITTRHVYYICCQNIGIQALNPDPVSVKERVTRHNRPFQGGVWEQDYKCFTLLGDLYTKISRSQNTVTILQSHKICTFNYVQ